MTTFLDGPAKGQCLSLRRSPELLRVVELNGKWDALDQPEDEPKPGEKVHIYRLVEHLGSAMLCRRGGGGGLCQIAKYKLDV
jgi:hypothetical protein